MLNALLDGKHLTEAEAGALLERLVDPDVDAALKAAWLVALRAKGETPEEVRGMAKAMAAMAAAV